MQKRLLFVLLLSSTMMMVSCRKDIEAVNIGANSEASSSNLRGRLLPPIPICQWESVTISATRDPRDSQIDDNSSCFDQNGFPKPCFANGPRSATIKVFSTLSTTTSPVPGFPLTLFENSVEVEATGFPAFESLGGRIEYEGDAKVTITVRVQGIPTPFVIVIPPDFRFSNGQIVGAISSSKVKNFGISLDCQLIYN